MILHVETGILGSFQGLRFHELPRDVQVALLADLYLRGRGLHRPCSGPPPPPSLPGGGKKDRTMAEEAAARAALQADMVAKMRANGSTEEGIQAFLRGLEW